MDKPLQVNVDILPQRKYFINGYFWNVYDETDKVMWDGYRGVHGWQPNVKLAWRITRFWIKVRYHV